MTPLPKVARYRRPSVIVFTIANIIAASVIMALYIGVRKQLVTTERLVCG